MKFLIDMLLRAKCDKIKKSARSCQHTREQQLNAPHFARSLPVHLVTLIAVICFFSTFRRVFTFQTDQVRFFKFSLQCLYFSKIY